MKLEIILFVELFFIIICGLLFHPESVDGALKIVGRISIICMAATLLSVFCIHHKIGFSFFLCVFSYVFSFGQSMLMLTNYNLSTTSPFSMRNGYFTPYLKTHRNKVRKGRFFVMKKSFEAQAGFQLQCRFCLRSICCIWILHLHIHQDMLLHYRGIEELPKFAPWYQGYLSVVS